MIFGYNTEICEGGTVFHVQSENHAHQLTLETQVFVSGQCIAKRCNQYGQAEVDSPSLQEKLRLQHRTVLDSIRSGSLDLNPTEPRARHDVDVKCVGATRQAGKLVLRFHVSRDRKPEPDVKIRCFLAEVDSVLASELISELVSDEDGIAELRVSIESSAAGELQLEVEGEEHRTVRRFRLRQGDGHP